MWFSIPTRSSGAAAIEPLSPTQQCVGKLFPSITQTGPCGYCFPLPLLPFMYSSSSPHAANGSRPRTHSSSKAFQAKVFAHRTGLPLAAVKPRTVKSASLVEARICDCPPKIIGISHLQHCLPSFACDIIVPTSSTNKRRSCLVSSYSVYNPKPSYSFLSTTIPSFKYHCLFGLCRNSPTHHLFVHFFTHRRKWKMGAPVCSLSFEIHSFLLKW